MRDLHILFAALMLGAMGSTPAYAMGPGVAQAAGRSAESTGAHGTG